MKTSLFDFYLPESHIAHMPSQVRDGARLLHVTHSDFHDRQIRDLTDLLDTNDVLVFNNTKVIPARLRGKRGDMSVEVLLHKCTAPLMWRCFAKPAKRLKVGQEIIFQKDTYTLTASVLEKCDSGEVMLSFDCPDNAYFWHRLESIGELPLPPYITRIAGTTDADNRRYQTVYAKHAGSVAAPTAGLHFTEDLLTRLKARGVEMHEITLHVGGGTFLPVKVEDTTDHVMHSEYGEISPATAAALTHAKASGKRIVAVGTTSLRTLESATDASGIIHPFANETNIFITPPYPFKAVNRLLTNFHLPKSTLFMLVSAFSGRERMLAAYHHAIAGGYRFYSYGDACLLERCA
jgi:S-adenosylmethionine:tRNA ribosyltransferase-isomerase